MQNCYIFSKTWRGTEYRVLSRSTFIIRLAWINYILCTIYCIKEVTYIDALIYIYLLPWNTTGWSEYNTLLQYCKGFFFIYLCVWSIKYLKSLIKEFLSNNCKLVCPLDPKLEMNYLCLYNIGAIKMFYISAVLQHN